MIAPVLLLVGIAFVAAIILGIAARVFYVKEDPRIEAVADILPGANCGGCGQAGCSSAAEAMVKGIIPVNSCVVGGTEVAEEIGTFLGYDVSGAEPSLACASCEGGYRATKKFIGPAPTGIMKRRTPEWIMNMILDPEGMVKNDPLARELLIEFNGSPMANQNLTEEDARAVLEYFRTLK